MEFVNRKHAFHFVHIRIELQRIVFGIHCHFMCSTPGAIRSLAVINFISWFSWKSSKLKCARIVNSWIFTTESHVSYCVCVRRRNMKFFKNYLVGHECRNASDWMKYLSRNAFIGCLARLTFVIVTEQILENHATKWEQISFSFNSRRTK